MPLDRDLAEGLVAEMTKAGWNSVLPDRTLPNPIDIEFVKDREVLRLIIHARRITPQASDVSTHNRPPGEMHMQMIFDGDKRGAGHKNYLRFAEGAKTVLFGFYRATDDYVIAAYDPERHREYAYSKSLQVKQQVVEAALKNGIAFQTRQNDETIVVFRLSEIIEYLNYASEFHTLSNLSLPQVNIAQAPPIVTRVLDSTLDPATLPQLLVTERKRVIAETVRYIRNYLFTQAIKRIYTNCAICGYQYDFNLDAAHIVPVAEGGTDTYDNGLGLCPNCHRMFDKGQVLVDENMEIHLNTRLAKEYDRIGLAGSLNSIQNSLRRFLWLPEDKQYHPSPENLRRTFLARR